MTAVEVKIYEKKTLIVNVYAPNGSKEKFFTELEKKLQEEAYKQLIVVGDFNGVVDPSMGGKGQKKNKQSKKGKLPKVFFDLTKHENLRDVWREKNPKTKDYTFYSSRHASFSRIDMIWTTSNIF